MSRELTVRGSFDVVFNGARFTEKLVFSYESPDRTKGWEITGAWMWMSPVGNTITANNNPALYGSLSTDTLIEAGSPAGDVDKIQTASDNRIVAWQAVHYRGFDAQDYFVGHATAIPEQAFLIDLDRIVTNELYIQAFIKANGGIVAGSPHEVNYLISMRERKLDPSESILQQLKGIGQDVTN